MRRASISWLCLSGLLGVSSAERGAITEDAASMNIAPDANDLLPKLNEAMDEDMRKDTASRLPGMEEALRPLFAALSKNEHGHLGPSAVRYALHRLFRRQHAWLVKGLAPTGDAWNISSPLAALQNEVPPGIQSLFDEHLRSSGLSLPETAALGVMIEELVYEESLERLRKAYQVQGLSVRDVAPRDQWEAALEIHMMSYIVTGDVANPKVRAKIGKVYPNWPATKRYIHRVMHEVVAAKVQYPSFADAQHVVREINARHGRWQDYECRSLKERLVSMEGRCPGRVDLGEFHGSSLNGANFEFSESTAYLRQLGALDESNAQFPSVIMPNYIDSPANYVGTSQFYAVVCLDECEELMGYIEREIRGPAASPAQIATLIKALPSSSVPGLRSVPASLLKRLDEIAAVHGGRVPLHGRLFAQFMHHAYPRECPYPHVAGETHLELPSEFKRDTGMSTFATEAEKKTDEEALQRARDDPQSGLDTERPCFAWSSAEELVAPLREPPSALDSSLRAGLYGAILGAALMLPFVCLAARFTRPSHVVSIDAKSGDGNAGAIGTTSKILATEPQAKDNDSAVDAKSAPLVSSAFEALPKEPFVEFAVEKKQ